MKYKALGAHVFAGGFTMGVRKVMDVQAQVEVFHLGKETVQSMELEFFQADDWHVWLDRKDLYEDRQFLFGNPRCTGFSCMTAGYSEEAHGAWAKQTRDVHELCNFGVEAGFEVICWESVQQAFSVGRELLDYLRDTIFIPNGYRLAHLFINAASFGNAQHRKRYFFLAYRDDKTFNIKPPRVLPERHTTVGDVLCTPEMLNRKVEPWNFKDLDYHPDCYRRPCAAVYDIIPHMPKGYGLNTMGRRRLEVLEQYAPDMADKWHERTSNMPFSMHDAYRLNDTYVCPVVAGDSYRFVHPTLDRPLTIRELSTLMSWPIFPIGDQPFAQLGKGIVPDVGEWLTEQVVLYLDDHWNGEDWESSYNDREGEWVGKDFTGDDTRPPEKIFNLTRYCPQKPEKVLAK